uniref:Protein kinase domain-containing protein n=1 Tax=Quercus lobata TaxID=97700 RepID=A0A7N2L796_QUELO
MALFRTRSSLHQAQKIHSLLLNQLSIFFLLSLPHAKSIHFNFPSFQPNESNLTFQGDAYADTEGLQITKNTRTRLVNSSVGRVSFHKQVCFWDNSTGRITDFVTHFSFIIQVINGTGTITNQTNTLSGEGLSFFIAPFESNIPNNSAGDTLDCLVMNNPVFSRYSSSLSYIVDLKTILPEWVRVGFSAATGALVESHTILSWSFSSNLEPKHRFTQPNKMKYGGTTHPNKTVDGDHKKKPGLVRTQKTICGIMHVWMMNLKKELGQEVSPIKGGKLGEGGFGGVYKGLLSESNVDVAVKRVSEGSKQGRKVYISEVKIISRLRHRNLVQLIGWCHEHDELLLVYEYMPNGSLDSHLYGAKTTLTWPGRYNVVQGLACALLYLHEEWEQCIVHRDIKPSNIMLDTNYNAKLGDFDLARLVDHDLGSKTTILAGTMGYLAPECATTGKASRESDVYSFGIVSLEIVCGRKPIEPQTEPNKVNLVEWVWKLHGKGQLFEAIDYKLNMEFDEEQIQCLVVVGLWCCHPDPAS